MKEIQFLHPRGKWEPVGLLLQPKLASDATLREEAIRMSKERGFPHRVQDTEKDITLFQCDVNGT